MIELGNEFKSFFYVASICLGLEIAFLIAFFISPREGWAIYAALVALAASVPLLASACVAAMVGYVEPLKTLLWAGLLSFVAWLALLFLSFSVLAALIFLGVSLIGYKMLQFHHADQKSRQN